VGLRPLAFGAPADGAPLALAGPAPFPFGASADGAPLALAGRAPFAFGAEYFGVPLFTSGRAPFAFGASADGTPLALAGRAPFAFGASADGTPLALAGRAPFAFANKAALDPPSNLASAPVGFNASAITTTGGGSVTPGATCGAAGELTVPSTSNYVLPNSTNQWFKIAVVSGTTYHVRWAINSGSGASVSIYDGSCAALNLRGGLNSITLCFDGAASANGYWFINCAGGFFGGPTDYDIEVGTGVC